MYGSLTALIMVMLWLYICMNLLLYGAEINAYFEKQFRMAQASIELSAAGAVGRKKSSKEEEKYLEKENERKKRLR
ncbi:MAG: YhjD/YihY/BrkB family envelope integrity protein [Ruminococcus sp.]